MKCPRCKNDSFTKTLVNYTKDDRNLCSCTNCGYEWIACEYEKELEKFSENTGKYEKHINSIKKAFELDDRNIEPQFDDYPQLSEKSKEPATKTILTNEFGTIKTVEEQIKERMDALDKRFDSIEQKLNQIIEDNKAYKQTKVDWTYTPIDVPFYNYQMPVDHIPWTCKKCPTHKSNEGTGDCQGCYNYNP